MRALLTPLFLLLTVAPAAAETIYLHGGSVIRGKILSRTADAIRVEITAESGGKAVMTLQLSRVRRIAPDSETPETMTEQGMDALRRGEVDAAEQWFEDALAARPTHAKAMVGLALAHSARGKVAEAISRVKRALLLIPTDSEAWYHLGLLQARASRYQEALSSFQRASQLRPDKALASKIKAQVARLRQVTTYKAQLNPQARAARARFDRDLGNNASAAAAGKVCLDMLRNLTRTIRTFEGDIYVELKGDPGEERHFAAGGSKLRYQTSVRVAQISFAVTIRSWEMLTNREKRQIIGSWVRYLKDLYPYATTICIVADESRRYLAEAAWYDIQNDVKIHWYRGRDSRRH